MITWFEIHIQRAYFREVSDPAGREPRPPLYPYQQRFARSISFRSICVVQLVE